MVGLNMMCTDIMFIEIFHGSYYGSWKSGLSLDGIFMRPKGLMDAVPAQLLSNRADCDARPSNSTIAANTIKVSYKFLGLRYAACVVNGMAEVVNGMAEVVNGYVQEDVEVSRVELEGALAMNEGDGEEDEEDEQEDEHQEDENEEDEDQEDEEEQDQDWAPALDAEANCKHISAEELQICWGDDPSYWKMVRDKNSIMYPKKIARLRDVCWFDVKGETMCSLPPEAFSLLASAPVHRFTRSGVPRLPTEVEHCSLPTIRGVENGRTEYDIGEFDVEGEEDCALKFAMQATDKKFWKSGLSLDGVLVRPKRLIDAGPAQLDVLREVFKAEPSNLTIAANTKEEVEVSRVELEETSAMNEDNFEDEDQEDECQKDENEEDEDQEDEEEQDQEDEDNHQDVSLNMEPTHGTYISDYARFREFYHIPSTVPCECFDTWDVSSNKSTFLPKEPEYSAWDARDTSEVGEEMLQYLFQIDPWAASQFGLKDLAVEDFVMRLYYETSVQDGLPQKCSTYIILSYTWHTSDWALHPSFDCSLKRDARPLSPAMWSAFLKQRRNPSKGLWCDQICIDQKSDDEKELTIGAMDLLYKNARKVVVALEDIAISEKEMDLLMTLDPVEYLEQLHLENDKIASAFGKIVQARWFQRAWILHEFLVCRNHRFLVPVINDKAGDGVVTILRLDAALMQTMARAFQFVNHQNTRRTFLPTPNLDLNPISHFMVHLDVLIPSKDLWRNPELPDSTDCYMDMYSEIFSLGAFKMKSGHRDGACFW